jgi:hypothetical protein
MKKIPQRWAKGPPGFPVMVHQGRKIKEAGYINNLENTLLRIISA